MDCNIEVIRGNNISRDDLINIIELNKISYGEDLTAPLALVESIYNKNRDICIIAMDRILNKIIGYISALPLTNEAFNRMIDPCFEEEISEDDILEYDYLNATIKHYSLYISSIVVDKAYQKHGAFKKLYNSFIGFLLELGKNNNIYFDEIVARATPKGSKICQFLGMKHIGTANNGEKIFHLKMLPPSFKVISDKSIELIRLYEDMYRKSQHH